MSDKKKTPPKYIDYVLGHENFLESLSPKIGNLNPIKKSVDTSVKEALTLTVKEPSKKPTTIPYEFLDDPDELDKLSPSQVSVSINVGDLITNPVKTTTDFIKRSFRSVTNVNGDIDNVIIKENVWKPLAQGKKPGSSQGSGILEKVIGAGMYQTVKFIDPTNVADGVGFSEDIAGDLRDYSKTETAYQMGHGEIQIPSNPSEKFVDTFANGMTSLSSTSKREDSFTNISLGMLGVLDSQVTRDSNHDYSYILGSEMSDLLNSRVSTYSDSSIDTSINPQYKSDNKTKIVDHSGNSALTHSIEKTKDSYTKLKKEKEEFRALRDKSTSLEAEINNPSTTLQRKSEIRRELKSISSSLKIKDERVQKAQKQYTRDSYELIGDGTSNGLLQNIVGAAAVSALDPSNPDHKKVLDVIDTYKKASGSSNNLVSVLEDGSLEDKTNELVSISVDAAIKSSDSSLIFRTQNDVLQGVNNFSISINNNLSKGYNKNKSSSNFSAQELASNKDLKLIERLEYQISKENDSKKVIELTRQLNDVKQKSENGVDILVNNSRKLVTDELQRLKQKRALLGSNEKALREFDSIFGKHLKELEKMDSYLTNNQWNRKSINNFLQKQNSIYSTNTIGGGIKDSTTRKFMDTLFYKKNSELSKVFRESVDEDTFKRAKILHRLSRNEYEEALAGEVLKIYEKGPEGLVGELTQRFIKERVGLAFNVDLSIKNVLKENLLKPLAYGGLMASDALEDELGNSPGLKGFLYRRFGRRFSSLFGKNYFNVKIDGKSLKLLGGAHFEGAVGIGNLINSGKLSSAQIAQVINAKDIKSLEGILKGLIFKKADMEALEKDIKNFSKFKDWLTNTPEGIKAAKFLGVTFDKNGNMIMNSKLSKFFQSLANRANNPSLISPVTAFAGALAKVSQFLSVLQGKFKNIIAAIRRPMAMLKKVVVTAITNFLTGLVSGVTGGLGIILRVFIKVVVQKLVDLGSKFLAGILKGDINKFTDALEETFKTFSKWIALIFLPFIIILVEMSDISAITSAIPVSKVTYEPVSTVVPKYDPTLNSGVPLPGYTLSDSCLEGIGIFTAGGADATNWITTTQPNMVVVYSDLSYASQIDSSVLVVGRSQNFTNIPKDVDDAISRVKTELPRLISSYPDIDVWQGFNEPVYNLINNEGLTEEEALDWLIDYERELHRIITGMGKEVCLGNFKESYPENLSSVAFKEYVDFAKNLDDAYLCVHEHEDSAANWGFGDRYNGRFTEINEDIGLPVLVTVMGIDSAAGPTTSSGSGYKTIGISDEEYLELLVEYNEAAISAGAEGVAVFQLGLGSAWYSFDVTSLLDVDCSK